MDGEVVIGEAMLFLPTAASPPGLRFSLAPTSPDVSDDEAAAAL
jgi:hypothetical protein